jgi:hypothetical protein
VLRGDLLSASADAARRGAAPDGETLAAQERETGEPALTQEASPSPP